MKERLEILEIEAEKLREKLDTVKGEELTKLDLELALVEEDINKLKSVKNLL